MHIAGIHVKPCERTIYFRHLNNALTDLLSANRPSSRKDLEILWYNETVELNNARLYFAAFLAKRLGISDSDAPI